MGELISKLLVKPTDALGTKTVEVKESPPENCWRLIHNGKEVTHLFEGSGKTWTNGTLFCAATKDDCQKEIDRLGLKPLPEEEVK